MLLPVDLDCEEEEEELSGTLKERPSETARRRTRLPLDMSDAPSPSTNSTFGQKQAQKDWLLIVEITHFQSMRSPAGFHRGIFPTELYTAILKDAT